MDKNNKEGQDIVDKVTPSNNNIINNNSNNRVNNEKPKDCFDFATFQRDRKKFIESIPPEWKQRLMPMLHTNIDSLDYCMSHQRRGYCLILDNENFHPSKNMSPRKGSKADSLGLSELFNVLGFDVRVLKDLTANEIKNYMKKYASIDHTNNDCFACCVLTHGEHGHLWGYDTKFPIDTIFNYFLGSNCSTLVGKPKLFFIQACQGDRLDPGVNIAGDAFDAVSYFKIPTHADFLIAYSTLPGFYSWRNTESGSWFMQSLIRVVKEYHMALDLLSMLTIVSKEVAYKYQSNAATEEFNGKKQVPCTTTMLTRRVFLKPKVHHSSLVYQS